MKWLLLQTHLKLIQTQLAGNWIRCSKFTIFVTTFILTSTKSLFTWYQSLSIAENLSYFASYEVTRIEANLISSQESKFLPFIQLQEIISSGLAVIITNTTSNATAYPVALRCQMSMCDIVTVVALRTWWTLSPVMQLSLKVGLILQTS